MKKASTPSQADLDCIERYAAPPLRIGITGGHGMIGSRLIAFLTAAGHSPFCIPRSLELEPCDVVVNLAGASIAKRWTRRRRAEIYSSRVGTTERLVSAMEELERPPRLISTSATGYYGDRSDELLDELSRHGRGFLANVCVEWERAAHAYTKGSVTIARFGVVLAREGGMLNKLLLPFCLGLGGPVGSGEQYVSWIAIDDLTCALYHLICSPEISGTFLLSAPHPIPNALFAKALADQLRRPAWLPLPAPLVRLFFGDMGKETLLASTRAAPQHFEESGGRFLYPTIEMALAHLLG